MKSNDSQAFAVVLDVRRQAELLGLVERVTGSSRRGRTTAGT